MKRTIWQRCAVGAVLALAALLAGGPLVASEADVKAFQRAVERGIEYLSRQGQAADGSYSAQVGPGVTAVVTYAILRHGRSPDDPLVAKSLKYLEKFIQPDGGIYQSDGFQKNYETCLGVMCFAEANRDRRYAKVLLAADKFLKDNQWTERAGQEPSSVNYGGAGYGKNKRPDLSNTSFLIDALRAAGNGPDDEAIRKALIFVSRCQNLESEHNTTPFAAKNPDGGFYYTPASGGVSMADKTSEGGLRSYGSMTYAGLKSMIHAGVGSDDPRVKAAFSWIQKHFDIKANPGMGDNGLYYYYHVFAKALDAIGQDTIEDARGKKHDWRTELRTEILSRQRANGSWLNDNSRWLEGDPNLVSAYALLSLAYCRPKGVQGG